MARVEIEWSAALSRCSEPATWPACRTFGLISLHACRAERMAASNRAWRLGWPSRGSIVRAAWTASAALGGCGRAWPVDTGKEEMCSDSRKRPAPTAVRGGETRSSAADAVLHGLDGGVLVYTLGRQHGECAHQVVESVGLGRFAR